MLIPFILAAFHLAVAVYSSANLEESNKVVSLVLQIIGGLIILYSIDSNLGIVNKKSLITIFNAWLQSFPLIGRPVTIVCNTVSTKSTAYPAKIRTGGPGKTTIEHLEYLQQQIDWLKEDRKEDIEHFQTLLSKSDQQKNEELSAIRTTLGIVDSKITGVSTGGVKWQMFGLLLMIYGSVANYYA